jgi:hypothetical protein
VGAGPGTQAACPGQAGESEARFLGQLAAVDRFGFMTGQLMLSYTAEGRRGVMLFGPLEPEPELGL